MNKPIVTIESQAARIRQLEAALEKAARVHHLLHIIEADAQKSFEECDTYPCKNAREALAKEQS